MAGGTKIALDLKSGQSPHRHVVALRRVEGLRSVVVRNGSLWLGSMATHSELERSADVRNHHPSITRAFASIANVRIRNQGTIGGNVAAADSSHDPPPVLIVFDAAVHIVGPNDEPREVRVDEFFVDEHRTVLRTAELIVGIEIPNSEAPALASTYLRFTPGSKEDQPTVTVAASLRLDADGRISTVRVALGAIAAIPVRARAVEDALDRAASVRSARRRGGRTGGRRDRAGCRPPRQRRLQA